MAKVSGQGKIYEMINEMIINLSFPTDNISIISSIERPSRDMHAFNMQDRLIRHKTDMHNF